MDELKTELDDHQWSFNLSKMQRWVWQKNIISLYRASIVCRKRPSFLLPISLKPGGSDSICQKLRKIISNAYQFTRPIYCNLPKHEKLLLKPGVNVTIRGISHNLCGKSDNFFINKKLPYLPILHVFYKLVNHLCWKLILFRGVGIIPIYGRDLLATLSTSFPVKDSFWSSSTS